MLCFTGKV